VAVTGGCHCRRVRFEVYAEPERGSECNCSICAKKGFLHWIVPRDRFRLLTSPAEISTYRFNTGIAQHHFCRTCGIASFYVPRSDPDKIDVNLRCVDGLDVAAIPLDRFDGRNWEHALAQRGES
jgi:hypothetical protein